jgi:hypothetical protein
MRARWFLAPLALILLLAGCASPPSRDAEKVNLLVDYLNGASTDELMAQSDVPFLFDGETLVLERQLRTVWENLATERIEVSYPVETPIPIDSDSAALLDGSADVASFLEMLPRDASLVYTRDGSGSIWLLLAGNSGDLALIRGIGRVTE